MVLLFPPCDAAIPGPVRILGTAFDLGFLILGLKPPMRTPPQRSLGSLAVW